MDISNQKQIFQITCQKEKHSSNVASICISQNCDKCFQNKSRLLCIECLSLEEHEEPHLCFMHILNNNKIISEQVINKRLINSLLPKNEQLKINMNSLSINFQVEKIANFFDNLKKSIHTFLEEQKKSLLQQYMSFNEKQLVNIEDLTTSILNSSNLNYQILTQKVEDFFLNLQINKNNILSNVQELLDYDKKADYLLNNSQSILQNQFENLFQSEVHKVIDLNELLKNMLVKNEIDVTNQIEFKNNTFSVEILGKSPSNQFGIIKCPITSQYYNQEIQVKIENPLDKWYGVGFLDINRYKQMKDFNFSQECEGIYMLTKEGDVIKENFRQKPQYEKQIIGKSVLISMIVNEEYIIFKHKVNQLIHQVQLKKDKNQQLVPFFALTNNMSIQYLNRPQQL